MPHDAKKPSVADLLAASKEASWHGVPEGVKLLLAAVEALFEDVSAQGAVIHDLARGGQPAMSSAASPHAFIGAMLQGSGSGLGEAAWRGAPHVKMPASAAGKAEARSDQIGGGETTVPAMMLKMMQEKLKAERAMRGDPTDGPRKELMELLERSPLDMTPEERLQGLASVIDGFEKGSASSQPRAPEAWVEARGQTATRGELVETGLLLSASRSTTADAQTAQNDASAATAPVSAAISAPPLPVSFPPLLVLLDSETVCHLWPRERLLSGMCACKHLLHSLGSAHELALRPIRNDGDALAKILSSESALVHAAALLPRFHRLHLHISCALDMHVVAAVLRASAVGANGPVDGVPRDGGCDRKVSEWQGLIGVNCIRKGRSWTKSSPQGLDGRNTSGLESLAAVLPQFPSLESLAISGCAKESSAFQLVSASVGALTRLKALDLSNNDCGDQAVDHLVRQDLMSSSLTSLCLNGNRLGPAGAGGIGGGSAALAGLLKLEIAENWLRDEGVEVLVELLKRGEMPLLAHLDLARNGIGAEGAQALASAFERGAATCLEVLILNMNWIGARGAAVLAPTLSDLPVLVRLAVSQNELQFEGGAGWLATLGACQELTHLDLSNNALGHVVVAGLPPKLQHLDLAENALQDAGAESLSNSLAGLACCSTLRVVDLRLNHLSEAALAALRQLVGCCTRLHRLDLRGNAVVNQPQDCPQMVI